MKMYITHLRSHNYQVTESEIKFKSVGSPSPGPEPLNYSNHVAMSSVKLSFKLSNSKNFSDFFDEGSFLARPCYF